MQLLKIAQSWNHTALKVDSIEAPEMKHPLIMAAILSAMMQSIEKQKQNSILW